MSLRVVKALSITVTVVGALVAILGGVSLAQGARYSTTTGCTSPDCLVMKGTLDALMTISNQVYSTILLVVGIVVGLLGSGLLWFLGQTAPEPAPPVEDLTHRGI